MRTIRIQASMRTILICDSDSSSDPHTTLEPPRQPQPESKPYSVLLGRAIQSPCRTQWR